MKHPHPDQRSLFDSPALSLGTISRAVQFALNRVAAESKMSREEILEAANKLAAEAGINLSKGNGALSLDVLNKMLNPNEPAYKPSFDAFNVLYHVLGRDRRLIEPFLEAWGVEAMGPEDRKYRDLGRLETELKCLRKKKRQIEETV